MVRKQSERAILNMVYAKDRIDEIVVGENPDFQIRNKHQQNFFGVEITELYYTESNARLDNISGYLGEILDGRGFRHRKDIKELAVEQFTLQSDGKPDQQVEGIIQELPSVSKFVQLVVDIVNTKGLRIKDYMQDLTHVNLIIYDTGGRLSNIPQSDFYQMFFMQSLRDTLCNSEFGEIFFITKLDKWVYIPLKMLLLVSQLYMFDGVLKSYYHHLNVESPREELSLFACYLYRIGLRGIYISDTKGGFEVICGKYGVIVNDTKELIVRDYADYPIPQSAMLFTSKYEGTFIDDAFEKYFNEFVRDNAFLGGCIFDVNNAA